MIEGVLFACALLCLLGFMLMIWCAIEFFALKRMIGVLQSEASKGSVTLRILAKNVVALEKSIHNQQRNAVSNEQQSRYSSGSNTSLEHQYERAKRLLQHNAKDDVTSYRHSDMTEEEIELLTQLYD